MKKKSSAEQEQSKLIEIKAKVNPFEYAIIKRLAIEKFGLRSIYYLLKLFVHVLVTFEEAQHGIVRESYDHALRFLQPFLDLDSPKEYIDAGDASFGGKNGNSDGSLSVEDVEIEKIIVIRKGGFLDTFSFDESKTPCVCHSQDVAALSVLCAGRKQFEKQIRGVMSAFGTNSFVDFFRTLLRDAQADIERLNNNKRTHYACITYGDTPTRKRGLSEEYSCINPYVRKGTDEIGCQGDDVTDEI